MSRTRGQNLLLAPRLDIDPVVRTGDFVRCLLQRCNPLALEILDGLPVKPPAKRLSDDFRPVERKRLSDSINPRKRLVVNRDPQIPHT